LLANGTYASKSEQARVFFMNGTGEVCSHVQTKKETAAVIKAELLKLKARCDRMGVPYPKYFVCDDAGAWEKVVLSVFEDAEVKQDTKHLINRPVEILGTVCEGAAEFSVAFHGAFTASEVPVRSRTGKVHMFDGPLDPPEVIIQKAEKVIRQYELVYPSLFSTEFKRSWETQKANILKYVHEVYDVDGTFIFKQNVLFPYFVYFIIFVPGKHYYESDDGVFHLLRGTNRNESLHKRVKHVWPEKLGSTYGFILNDCS